MCDNNCNHSFSNDSDPEIQGNPLLIMPPSTFIGGGYSGPKKPHPKFVAYCKEEFQKANNLRYFGSKVLIHYLVDDRNQRFGMIVAYQDGKAIRFGWSICQTNLDKWDKYVGFHYAFKRSKSNVTRVPRYMAADFDIFVERAIRYFKVDPENFISNLGTPVME